MRLTLVLGIIVGFLGCNFSEKETYRELKGATVIVTGASKGIGEEIAYAYAKKGSRLFLTARSEELLINVATECKRLGAAQAYYLRADMSKEADVELLHRTANEKFHKKVDYLILNHALQVHSSEWTGTKANLSLLRKMHEVNFYSYVQSASLFMPEMELSGGRIVVISSVIGKLALPFFSPYSSTKFALQGFFGSLQHELYMRSAPFSITLAALGRIDTETQRDVMSTANYKRKGIIPPGEAVDATAEAILLAAYRRKREFFYPVYSKLGYIASTVPIVSDVINYLIGWQFEKA